MNITPEFIAEKLRHQKIRPYMGDFLDTPELQNSFNRNALKEAAVLMLLDFSLDEPSMLFTRRPLTMMSFPGHWVFPGGKKDKTDESKIHTALRETFEEVGLSDITILSTMQDYHIKNGVNVTPVIGYTVNHKKAQTSEEVDQVSYIPLSKLLSRSSQSTFQIQHSGLNLVVPRFQVNDIAIENGTAGMLKNFLDHLLIG